MKNAAYRKQVADNIREARECHGYSQKDLAERSGLSSSYISQVECGRRMPNLINAVKIASGLDYHIGDLYGFAELLETDD